MNHYKIKSGVKLTVTIRGQETPKEATITDVVRTRLTDLKILFDGETNPIRLQYDNGIAHEELEFGYSVQAYLLKGKVVTTCDIKVKTN